MDRRIAFTRPRLGRLAATTLAAAALATSTVAPTARAAALNPPPPDFERCQPAGGQTICHGTRVEPGGMEGTGIICGTGPGAFEIVDRSGFVRQEATRWYDADGNLVRRTVHEVWQQSAWTNPLAGTAVEYRQSVTYTDAFEIPGDVGTAVETTTGVVSFVVPGAGAIVQNAGRTVIGADGAVEFRSGPQAFLDFFVAGDADALQPLCDALAG